MALIKNLELSNGIILNYHRIESIDSKTNCDIKIRVNSYLSKERRINQVNNNTKEFIQEKIYRLNYIEDFTISKAYEYLKTLNDFENAEDDSEEVTKIIENNEALEESEGLESEEIQW